MALRDWVYRSALYNLALWGPAPSELRLRLAETWPGDPQRGEALLGQPLQWTAENHCFGFLADFAALGTEPAVRAARAAASDWLKRCDAIEPVSWSAEILGERLFAWIAHYDLLAAAPQDPEFRRALLMSLARQARYLHGVWRQAAGVARLRALRGLVAALAALDDGRRLRSACARLAAEAQAQILPDGGHVSRGPHRQLAALMALIDARDALSAVSAEISKAVMDAIDRAAPMLRFFRHGDGGLALFNGAAAGDVALIELALLRSVAKGRPPARAPRTGYERLQAGRSLALFDCGAPPPPPFDGDAHAGALAFELSHGRERLVVNCGAYLGGDSGWRAAMRATAAHSTLIVADTASATIGRDGHFAARPEVKAQRNEQDGNVWVGASHTGYVRSFGLRHERELYLAADGEDLRGEDRLVVVGDGPPCGHGFAIRFHLHPDIQASTTQDGNAVLLKSPSGVFWRLKAAGAVMNLAESVYLGDGTVRKTQQVVLDGHAGSTGAVVKWALKREAKKGEKPAGE
ncbi:MAG: heparinase II/III family protein [Alphaproteobacteria bacterium]|nr:heparinase II/III family protein [Alphaproteobacteria bacterium]